MLAFEKFRSVVKAAHRRVRSCDAITKKQHVYVGRVYIWAGVRVYLIPSVYEEKRESTVGRV